LILLRNQLSGTRYRLNIDDMTTLSPTKARANLTHWLKRAAAGEDIGILCGDKVIALRAVTVSSDDTGYAQREYGVTDKELDAFVKRLKAENARYRRTGKMRRYTGDFNAAIRD
jgi:antitoxin (DNA-binding transcriptional repressor) of toxin-antitoxin stability system